MILRPSELKRRIFFIVLDSLIIFISVVLAYNLRFDFAVPEHFSKMYFPIIFGLISVRSVMFYLFKIYDISWRHFGFQDLTKVIYIFFTSTLLLVLAVYFVRNYGIIVPRSIVPIEFFISLFGILALRISKRLYLENFRKNHLGLPSVIIANPDRANTIIRALDQTQFYPVAIINDAYQNLKINGVHVYGWQSFLGSALECDVAIVDESLDIQSVYKRLSGKIVQFKVASSYSDYETRLHEISVEDLLARHPQDLDKEQIKNFIVNKVILVTGAGGSIGSEIARQCVQFGAKELLLLDHSEFNLYTIGEELAHHNIKLIMQTVVDYEQLALTFEKYRPQIVIHAAAYKHVPLVEENVKEAILNNIVGTKNCIDLSIAHNVDKFVLISTDKAVRPTNVMGATKRVCELYVQNVVAKNTEVVAVRFGNVLGSSGSVIPKFKKQIEEGGPITVTHPDITRYFMLIPEACELVLQAGAIGKGGEVFILDMGEPVRIVDLAKKMVELSGKSIDIVFTGLRAGEKLYEELLIDETDAHTQYNSIMVARATQYEISKLNNDINRLVQTVDLNVLKQIVPEFEHNKR